MGDHPLTPPLRAYFYTSLDKTLISFMGEHKANMLAWLRHGTAARVSGRCDDTRTVEEAEAVAFDAEPAHRPR